MQIQDQVMLVAGGGSGLGAATVRCLAAQGARAVVADLNATAATALCTEIGDQARFVATDVTDPASVEAALAAAAAMGTLRGVINCAGIALAEKTLSRRGPHTLDSFQRVIQTNLVGSFNVARLAAAIMAENPPDAEGERGVIVHTASIAAYEGQAGQVAYAAAKAGIVGMTLPMARELGPYGIRVVTIAPGVFDTPLLASLPEAARSALAEQVPFPPRLGRPEEFAALVAHCIANPMLNGAVLRLDGGLRMG
jgi:NAD(P)-dependent dehydrogenase (short-subunit alcohol dehydrogenase family)